MSSNKNQSEMVVSNKFHEINNYIRQHIALTKAQKMLFISSILICLKEDLNYAETYELNRNSSQTIIQRMLQTLQTQFHDKCFTDQFKCILKDISINELLYVIKLVKQTLLEIENKEEDIINIFYKEFTLWDSQNEGKLGVVLTPHDIVQLMINFLDIKSTDKVLDFCTGTGSFMLAANKYSKHVFACEKNDINYSVSKCNFVLNGLNTKNLAHGSCFNHLYKPIFDKIILNPPFSCKCEDQNNLEHLQKILPQEQLIPWQDFTNEQRFVLYGIQLLKEGGKGSFVIPRRNFNNNTVKNNKFKNEILKHTKIVSIINLSVQVFQPNAAVQCAILNVEKQLQTTNSEQSVQIIDFTKDGYKMHKNMRIKVQEPQPQTQTRILNQSSDWNFIAQQTYYPTLDKIREYNEQYLNTLITNNSYLEIPSPESSYIEFIPEQATQIKNFETIKIKEYFEIIPLRNNHHLKDFQDGIYPLIGGAKIDNGIVNRVNEYMYDGVYLTIAHTGSVGATFIQEGKFSILESVKVFKPIKEISKNKLHLIAHMLNEILINKYDYTNRPTNQKLLNEEIQIPKIEK